MKLLSHPLYLAPIPVYTMLYASDEMLIDETSPFVKQTFRNRAIIATEKGTQTLTIPVIHNGRQPMRDIRISEHGNWRHLHWNAIMSAYKKSPFFDYYADDFAHFFEERDGFLMDFNLRLHNVICELIGLSQPTHIVNNHTIKENCNDIIDVTSIAEPKVLSSTLYKTEPYYQVFAQRNGFIPNLSIADLLFNMGPESLIVLQNNR